MIGTSCTPSGISYITIGDGGNRCVGGDSRVARGSVPCDGGSSDERSINALFATRRADSSPPPQRGSYHHRLLLSILPHPTPRSEGLYTSWLAQPAWSAYRLAQYGSGLLEFNNATHATWSWLRNADGPGKVYDTTTFVNTWTA